MATYASLTEEEKAIVDNFDLTMRRIALRLVRAMNYMKALSEDTNATSIFQTLDNGEVIPNPSGLAGSDSMTRAELQSIFSEWQTLLTSHNTTAARNSYSKLIGVTNMVEQGTD